MAFTYLLGKGLQVEWKLWGGGLGCCSNDRFLRLAWGGDQTPTGPRSRRKEQSHRRRLSLTWSPQLNYRTMPTTMAYALTECHTIYCGAIWLRQFIWAFNLFFDDTLHAPWVASSSFKELTNVSQFWALGIGIVSHQPVQLLTVQSQQLQLCVFFEKQHARLITVVVCSSMNMFSCQKRWGGK